MHFSCGYIGLGLKIPILELVTIEWVLVTGKVEIRFGEGKETSNELYEGLG